MFWNAGYASATTERTVVFSVKGIRPMFPNPISLLQASMQNLLVFGNAVYASATTERTDVLSVKGIRPMFPNPTSLLQASLQNLLGSGNADANFSEYSELHEIYKKHWQLKAAVIR